MKNFLTYMLFVAVIIVFCFSQMFAAPFDTGFIQWSQPNGVTFAARYWGDEFEWWFETQDGYRII